MLLWIYLIDGIFFGVICSSVAFYKGRSQFGWFLVGFFFSILGLIIQIAIPKNQSVIDQRMVDKGEMKKCPYCAEAVMAEAKLCKHCGKELQMPKFKTRQEYEKWKTSKLNKIN